MNIKIWQPFIITIAHNIVFRHKIGKCQKNYKKRVAYATLTIS